MARRSSPPSRRTAIIAGVVVVALVAGVLLVRLTLDTSSSPARTDAGAVDEGPRPTAPPDEAGPAGEAAGVPVGFGADEPGAVAAAVAYSTASQRWLYFTDEEIEAEIKKYAENSGMEFEEFQKRLTESDREYFADRVTVDKTIKLITDAAVETDEPEKAAE